MRQFGKVKQSLKSVCVCTLQSLKCETNKVKQTSCTSEQVIDYLAQLIKFFFFFLTFQFCLKMQQLWKRHYVQFSSDTLFLFITENMHMFA